MNNLMKKMFKMDSCFDKQKKKLSYVNQLRFLEAIMKLIKCDSCVKYGMIIISQKKVIKIKKKLFMHFWGLKHKR